MFPEGARSKDGRLHKAHPGTALLALRSEAPILPVAISGTEKRQHHAPAPRPAATAPSAHPRHPGRPVLPAAGRADHGGRSRTAAPTSSWDDRGDAADAVPGATTRQARSPRHRKKRAEPMEIIRASDMGFCFGVRRAVEMAEKAAAELGRARQPGLHRPQPAGRRPAGGAGRARRPEARRSRSGRAVIIPSHGVAPAVIGGGQAPRAARSSTPPAPWSRARSNGRSGCPGTASPSSSSATPTIRRCAACSAGRTARAWPSPTSRRCNAERACCRRASPCSRRRRRPRRASPLSSAAGRAASEGNAGAARHQHPLQRHDQQAGGDAGAGAKGRPHDRRRRAGEREHAASGGGRAGRGRRDAPGRDGGADRGRVAARPHARSA